MSDPADPRGERLDPDEVDAVLRRATELGAPGAPEPRGVDRRTLSEAAAEVGIERAAVELALAEHDAGMLRTRAARGGLLGPSRVAEVRDVPLDPVAARARVSTWLTRQLLRRDERRGSAEVWRPRDDLGAKVRRKVDGRTTRRLRLGELDAVIASVAALGEGRSVVRLEASFDDMRTGLRSGLVVIPAAVAPAAGLAAAALLGEFVFLLGSVPLGGVLGGLGAWSGRRTLADQRDATRRALRGLLDELEGV